MKIVQIFKQLNNTELGKGGTHDTYVLIPNDLDISDVFEPESPIEFKETLSDKTVTVRNTVGREKRIVGLGQYYRENGLCAGDEIIFEKKISGEDIQCNIYHKKHFDNLVIQKNKYGFDILTIDRLEKFVNISKYRNIDLQINYLKSERKRNDSPDKTDFYDVVIQGNSLLDKYNGKDIVELTVLDNQVFSILFYGWKKFIFEVEE